METASSTAGEEAVIFTASRGFTPVLRAQFHAYGPLNELVNGDLCSEVSCGLSHSRLLEECLPEMLERSDTPDRLYRLIGHSVCLEHPLVPDNSASERMGLRDFEPNTKAATLGTRHEL